MTSARTKLVTSSLRTPVRASPCTSRTLSSVAITSGSFWKPSRGPTSRIRTVSLTEVRLRDERFGERADDGDDRIQPRDFEDAAQVVGADDDHLSAIAHRFLRANERSQTGRVH